MRPKNDDGASKNSSSLNSTQSNKVDADGYQLVDSKGTPYEMEEEKETVFTTEDKMLVENPETGELGLKDVNYYAALYTIEDEPAVLLTFNQVDLSTGPAAVSGSKLELTELPTINPLAGVAPNTYIQSPTKVRIADGKENAKGLIKIDQLVGGGKRVNYSFEAFSFSLPDDIAKQLKFTDRKGSITEVDNGVIKKFDVGTKNYVNANQGMVLFARGEDGKRYVVKIMKRADEGTGKIKLKGSPIEFLKNLAKRITLTRAVTEEFALQKDYASVLDEKRYPKLYHVGTNVVIKEFVPGSTLEAVLNERSVKVPKSSSPGSVTSAIIEEKGKMLNDEQIKDLKRLFTEIANKKVVFKDLNAGNLMWTTDPDGKNGKWVLIDAKLASKASSSDDAFDALKKELVYRLQKGRSAAPNLTDSERAGLLRQIQDMQPDPESKVNWTNTEPKRGWLSRLRSAVR